MSEVSAKHVFGLSLLLVLTMAMTIVGIHPIPASGQAFAELSVNKQDNPDPVEVGELLAYTIEVSNLGDTTATDVVLEDVLDPNTDFVEVNSSSGTCVESNGTVTCELGNIAAGETATVEILVVPTDEAGEVGSVTNTATATATNATSDVTTETTAVVASDPIDPDNPGNDTTIPLGPEPTLPQPTSDQTLQEANQELEEEAVSGDAIPVASVENTGDNAALCVPVQQTPVTGNQQTGQGDLGIGTEDDTVFGSPELSVNPEQATNCAQVIQPV